jgi:BirA family transcriptional regulator, biotin operon repressor / biotin---[acetyl-CoA-carboxylase] ligase
MLLPLGDMVKKRNFEVHRVSRTPSTQDVVLRAAAAGAADGYCCVADEQTQGRGRLGRSWVAPPGTGLLASVLLCVLPRALEGLPFAAGLAVVDALATAYGVDASLKWPNDVLVDGRKLAGILVELAPGSAGRPDVAAVVGLGLNLHVARFPAGINGVSLHELTGDIPDADRVLQAWLEALSARVGTAEEDGIAALLPDWRAHATGLGERVQVVRPSGTVTGIAIDVATDGALLVRTADGVERVVAGHVNLSASPAT